MPPSPRVPNWCVVLALTALALALRWPGHDHGLPHRTEPDTYIVEQAAGLRTRGLFDRTDAAWKYPLLVATLVAAVPLSQAGNGSPTSVPEHLAAASREHSHTRRVVLALGALIAPVTFLLALTVVGRRAAALAGLLAAASLLHLCFSLQARPHAPAAVATTLALVAAVRFARRPNAASGLWLGLGSGCAAATLHTGLMVLAPCAVATVLALRAERARALMPLALAVGLFVGAACWAYIPGERVVRTRAAMEAAAAQSAEGSAVQFSGHVLPWSTFDGSGFGQLLSALLEYDPLLLALGAAGLVVLFVAKQRVSAQSGACRRSALWVFAGYFLPALAVYGAFARTEARLVLVFVPLLAIGVAALVDTLRGRLRTGAEVLLGALALVPAVQLARLRAAPDTTEAAAAWLTAELGDHEALAINVQAIPVLQKTSYAEPDAVYFSRWAQYADGLSAETRDALGLALRTPATADLRALWIDPNPDEVARAALARHSPRYVLLATSLPATVAPEGLRRALAAWRHAVREPAPGAAAPQLIQVFEPIPSVPEEHDADVGFQTTLAVLRRARAFGPRIEVWDRGPQ